MSRASSMNHGAVFAGLLFWSWVWGIWGMLLAVPMMMAIKVICDHVEPLRRSHTYLASETFQYSPPRSGSRTRSMRVEIDRTAGDGWAASRHLEDGAASLAAVRSGARSMARLRASLATMVAEPSSHARPGGQKWLAVLIEVAPPTPNPGAIAGSGAQTPGGPRQLDSSSRC